MSTDRASQKTSLLSRHPGFAVLREAAWTTTPSSNNAPQNHDRRSRASGLVTGMTGWAETSLLPCQVVCDSAVLQGLYGHGNLGCSKGQGAASHPRNVLDQAVIVAGANGNLQYWFVSTMISSEYGGLVARRA